LGDWLGISSRSEHYGSRNPVVHPVVGQIIDYIHSSMIIEAKPQLLIHHWEKGKGKVVAVLFLTQHHAMKAYRGSEVEV
jgi:hypothetical protein